MKGIMTPNPATNAINAGQPGGSLCSGIASVSRSAVYSRCRRSQSMITMGTNAAIQ